MCDQRKGRVHLHCSWGRGGRRACRSDILTPVAMEQGGAELQRKDGAQGALPRFGGGCDLPGVWEWIRPGADGDPGPGEGVGQCEGYGENTVRDVPRLSG